MPDSGDSCLCAFCTDLVKKVEGNMVLIDANLVVGWASLALCALSEIEGMAGAFSDERMAQYRVVGEAAATLLESLYAQVEDIPRTGNTDGRWN